MSKRTIVLSESIKREVAEKIVQSCGPASWGYWLTDGETVGYSDYQHGWYTYPNGTLSADVLEFVDTELNDFSSEPVWADCPNFSKWEAAYEVGVSRGMLEQTTADGIVEWATRHPKFASEVLEYVNDAYTNAVDFALSEMSPAVQLETIELDDEVDFVVSRLDEVPA